MKRSASSSLRSYHHGDLRASLLKAVIDVARSSGVSSVTMRAVAAKTGVSEAAAYHHFKNKADLLAAAASLAFDDFTAALDNGVQAELEAGGDPALGLVDGYLAFALSEPGEYQLIFGRHIVESGLDTRDDVRSAGAASIGIALSAIQRSITSRAIPETAEEVFPMLRAILHGVVSLVQENELEVDMSMERATELARKTVRALLDGLAAQQRPPSPAS